MPEPDTSQDDLLLPFEQSSIPEHYRPYFTAKRNNFLLV
jgi:hypothetical protein